MKNTQPKQYTIILEKIISRGTDNGRQPREVTGDLEYLKNYFANSCRNRSGEIPKTIKSLVKNIQRSYEDREAACYNRTFVELKKSVTKTVDPAIPSV